MDALAGVVMAAGRGKRMKSKVPKILHKVCGRELVAYPVEALRQAGVPRIVVVVSPDTEDAVKALLGDSAEYVCQAEPLGTGHALLQAAALLKGRAEHVLAINSDMPLVRPETLRDLAELHVSLGAGVSLVSALPPEPGDLARLVRDETGRVVDIVESRDEAPGAEGNSGARSSGIGPSGAGPSGAGYEVNGGGYCFQAGWLWDNLPNVGKGPSGELYLTAMVPMAISQGRSVEALAVEDPLEFVGINTRVHLSRAEALLRQRIRERWMLEGVTMMDPASTFLDATVEVGPDTVIYPNTMVLGRSRIGSDCAIGPGSVVQDSTIGDGCRVVASFAEEATLEDTVEVGPFSHLRPGTYLERDVHIGNFSEVKNSRLGQGVAMGHFGYMGDATVGANVNVGAGMVTCNYDGISKHRTIVEEGAFIGCDTMFVAPVKMGAGAVTGAGAVVTKDVPPGRLAVGVPATIKHSREGRTKRH